MEDVDPCWTTITAVADRLGIDQEAAEALAAELDEQGLVRVGGGHRDTNVSVSCSLQFPTSVSGDAVVNIGHRNGFPSGRAT